MSQPVRVMFYNVENLFDVCNDTTKDDDEFLPDGVRRWTNNRYDKKINSLYKVIMAAGEWSPPEIVAFCEVENRKVLEDLVYGTYLSKYNYSIIHEESPDLRGIDVCLIYRKEYIRIPEYTYLIPSEFKSKEYTTRSVLYAKILIDTDTLHLVVNHWPSRRGGVLPGETLRKEIALMIRDRTDSINKSARGNAKIIVLGDFNCTPDDQEIKTMISPAVSGRFLVNLSEKPASEGVGTYRYLGTWEMIDQVIVSDKLLTTVEGLATDPDDLKIFKPDFLLAKDPKYPGFTPFSTYKGFRYQGGFSDHLPVLLNLTLKYRIQLEKARSPFPF
jgi:hypothetical protein